MHNELTGTEQATDFLCPNCGIAAFEVVGTQWNATDDSEAGGEEFLIMKCLDCLHLFHYRLKGEEADLILSESQDTL